MTRHSLLCAPGYLAVRWPRRALALLAAALLGTLALMPRLAFEEDITRSFASDSAHATAYAEFLDTLGFEPRQIVILAKAPQPFGAADYEAIRDFAFDAELTDGVSAVYSPASVSFPAGHPRYPGAPLLPPEPALVEIEARLDALAQTGARSPVSADRRSALLVVSLAAGLDDAGAAAVLDALRAEAEGLEGVTVAFTGEGFVGPAIIAALKRDLVLFSAAGCALAFGVAILLFGNLRLVLVAVVPALLAAFLSIAWFPLLGIPVTVLNVVVPILVLVLALADSIHLTLHHVREERKTDTLEATLSAIGPACALAALTTAIAFASIAVSGNAQLGELALVGAAGVLFGHVVVMLVFPLMMALGPGPQGLGRRRLSLRMPAAFPAWVATHQRAILGASAALALVSGIGIAGLSPWFNLDQNMPTNSEVRQLNEEINADFGGYYRIWNELDISGREGLDSPETWRRLVGLTEAVQEAAPGYPVLSLASIAAWQGHPDRAPDAAERAALPPDLLRQLHSEEHGIARVIVLAPEAMQNAETLQIQIRLEAAARAAGAERSLGLPVLMRHEALAVVRQLLLGLAIATLFSTALVAAYFRAPRLAASLLLPNALPLAATAALLALAQSGQLTPTALLALTVGFGVAVDDSVHFVNRVLWERRQGMGLEEALQTASHETGAAMLVTTLLICSGMAVMMLSAFETIRLFGGLLIALFSLAMLCDLTLLPSLLRKALAK